jgi:glycolate oxidase iron-sulfur subunit
MANVFFARLNEATVRVLQKNGCEVHIPKTKHVAARCMFTPAFGSLRANWQNRTSTRF